MSASPVPAKRSTRRTRVGATVVLVAALATGWVVTTRASHGGTAPASASPSRLSGATTIAEPGADPGVERLLRLIPFGARCHRATRAPSVRIRCVVDGIPVEYRLVPAPMVSAIYFAAIGTDPAPGRSVASKTGHDPSTRPACSLGRLDEHSWSRISRPRSVAGRYSCRRERGAAAMWWTVSDRGLLVHAVAPDDDLASLFRWWLSHSER